MTGKQIINLLKQLLKSSCKTIFSNCKKCCKAQSPKTQWETDKDLNDFEPNTLLGEYLDMGTIKCHLYLNSILIILVIQFGFVTLFVAAFP